MLELETKVIDINLPAHHELLEKCRPLYEYAWFIQRIKENLRAGRERDEAVLNRWLKAAARVKGVDEFLEKLKDFTTTL